MAENPEKEICTENFYGVKLTGVSRDTTENDVRQFFNECTPSDVVMCDGGNVFVQFTNQEEFQRACTKDGHQLRWTKVGVLALVAKEDYLAAINPEPNTSVENNEETNKEDESQYNVIRLRGLPYSSTAADVMNFLKNVAVDNGEKGIHFSAGSHGRSTGEVFVEVCSPADVNIALKYDREHMGGRYIEIFRSSRAQLEWECRGAEKTGGSGGVVRLRGLPYGCSADDIRDFMKGIAIADNGITIQTDETHRETGEAFIEVITDKDVEKALDRHKKSIGHRYIEVFRTTQGDIRPVASRWASHSRPTPYPMRGERSHEGHRSGRPGGRGRGGGGGNYGNPYGGHYAEPYYRGSQGGGNGNMTSYRPMRTNEPVSQYSASSAGKHMIRMRGLPYSVTIKDIQDFFAPFVPINIIIEQDGTGRLSGAGEVAFGCHDDAAEAMRKDKGHIGSRYIELFLHSKENGEPGTTTTAAVPHPQSYETTTWSNDPSYTSYSNHTDPRTQSTQGRPQIQQQYGQQSYQQQPVYGSHYTATANATIPAGTTTITTPQPQYITQPLQPTQHGDSYAVQYGVQSGVQSGTSYGYAAQTQQPGVGGANGVGGVTNTSGRWY